MNTEGRVYDIAIIGGGVTGTAQAYVFTHFVKGISNVLLLEKNENVALVNSNTDSNAQTLHGGDTETNFSLEKALKMRDAECILGAFLEKYGLILFFFFLFFLSDWLLPIFSAVTYLFLGEKGIYILLYTMRQMSF